MLKLALLLWGAIFAFGYGESVPTEPPLIAAVNAGDIPKLKELLRDKPDLNATDPDGANALHRACLENRVEAVKLLLEAGADPNRRVQLRDFEHTGEFPNHNFNSRDFPLILTTNVQIVRLLLSAGADPNLYAGHVSNSGPIEYKGRDALSRTIGGDGPDNVTEKRLIVQALLDAGNS